MSYSKNIEATGIRIKAYDQWRANLPALKDDTFLNVEWVEHSRGGIHCVVFFSFPKGGRASGQDLENAAVARAASLRPHKSWLDETGVPIYCVAASADFDFFWVKDFKLDSPALLTSRSDYVKNFIKQKFPNNKDPKVSVEIKDEVSAYSVWHRHNLDNSSYLHDVDYVETRRGNPVFLNEVTQANSEVLRKGFFDYMTRGYTQSKVLLAVAQKLNVPAYLTVYPRNLQRIFLVQLNAEMVEMGRHLPGLRDERSRHFQETENLTRPQAQGRACQILFDENQPLIEEMLCSTNNFESSIGKYEKWLQEK